MSVIRDRECLSLTDFDAHHSRSMPGCVQCKSEVEGEVEGIPLTICCRRCCTEDALPSNRTQGDARLISKSKAKKICKRCQRRLNVLRFVSKTQGYHVTYLYIKKEVEVLSRLPGRRVRSEWTKRLEEKQVGESMGQKEQLQLLQSAKQKKAKVEKLTNTKMKDMNPVLRAFLLQDYLTLKPTVSSTTVLERCRVYNRAKMILSKCVASHPDAVFDFCITYPNGGPNEFQQLKNKMQSVFHTEGTRILYNVPKSERASLVMTPLADVYAEFEKRDTRAITRGHLEKLVGPETADTIMEHPACQRRLEIGGLEAGVAQKLVEFWKQKDDIDKRTKRLKEALEAHGSYIRDDCELCKQYIEGSIDCDLKEVVAIVGIFEELRGSSMCPHGERITVGTETFRQHYYDQEIDFETSLESALSEAKKPGLSDACPLQPELSSASEDEWVDDDEWW